MFKLDGVIFELRGVIGHRGASAYAPENTIEAFQHAYDLGCRLIEFDVVLNAEGEAFVFHDESLKRTTGSPFEIGHVSSSHLKSLDAGSWFSREFHGAKIPTLKETLIWLAQSDMNANIEIKPYPGFTAQTTQVVIDEIVHYWPKNKNWPILSSFDFEALRLCKISAPQIPRGMLLDSWQNDWQTWADSLKCLSVNVNRFSLTAKRVQAIKAEQYKVCVYTVNRLSTAKKLFSWGVDAVFSNYPDLMMR